MKLWVDGAAVDVPDEARIASSARSAVYALGERAIKVFREHATAPDAARLAALARIDHRSVLVPTGIVADADGRTIGYAMSLAPSAESLTQLYGCAARAARQITDALVLAWIAQLRDAIAAAHAAGAHVVTPDAPLRALVSGALDAVVLHAVDRFVIAGGGSSDASRDWTALAWTALQLLLGARHGGAGAATVDVARLLTPEHHAPEVAHRVAAIPESHRAWLVDALGGREVGPPPDPPRAMPRRTAQPLGLYSTPQAAVRELAVLPGPVWGVWASRSHLAAATGQRIWLNGAMWTGARVPPGRLEGVTFGARGERPVALVRAGAFVHPVDLVSGARLPFSLASAVSSVTGAAAHLGSADQIFELCIADVGGTIVARPRAVGPFHPLRARIYGGVAIESCSDQPRALLLHQDGAAQPIELRALAGYRVLDAQRAGSLLVVIAATGRRIDRIVLRLHADTHDGSAARDPAARIERDVPPMVANAVWLDSETGLSTDGQGRIELIALDPSRSEVDAIDLPVLGTDIRLVRRADQLIGWRDRTIFSLTLRAAH